jgi:hypothetical protein
VLLYENNKSIRNLNHSVMKLMAVQQESLVLSRSSPTPFLIMDRVPVFLEVEAAQMPFPLKVFIRPNKRFGYSESVVTLIKNSVSIFISNKTKCPSNRSHQLAISSPMK